MSIDATQVAAQMVAAAKGVVGTQWPTTQKYIQSEATVFAQRLATIAELSATHSISQERAKSLVDFQKESWETVLLAVEGLTQLMVEAALNAALDAVKGVVNTAIGFALL